MTRRRDPGVTRRWLNAMNQQVRRMMLDHAHEEALRQEAQRAQRGFFEALRPGTKDRPIEPRGGATPLRPMPPAGTGVWAQHLGRPPSGDREDYFPGRPADAPEPTEYIATAPGVTGVPLGRAAANMSSEAEQARALTYLGIQACENAVVTLGVSRDRANEAIQMFLAAGAGSHQHAVREAVELAAAAQERMDDAMRAITEAAMVAGRLVW
jgi:hypothetical protein